MTIIVDANTTHRLWNGDMDGAFILDRIISGESIFITGGKHKDEIIRAGFSRRLFRQLQIAGRLRVYSDYDCSQCEIHIVSMMPLISDDPHIIALSLHSGCRVLYSFDANLCTDFKNKNIIDSPRGKIFHSKKHLHILKNAPAAK